MNMLDKLSFDSWMEILIYIDEHQDTNIQDISYALTITYSHTHKVCNLLKKYELITSTKKGRIVMMKLTDRGRTAAQHIKGLLTLFYLYD